MQISRVSQSFRRFFQNFQSIVMFPAQFTFHLNLPIHHETFSSTSINIIYNQLCIITEIGIVLQQNNPAIKNPGKNTGEFHWDYVPDEYKLVNLIPNSVKFPNICHIDAPPFLPFSSFCEVKNSGKTQRIISQICDDAKSQIINR